MTFLISNRTFSLFALDICGIVWAPQRSMETENPEEGTFWFVCTWSSGDSGLHQRSKVWMQDFYPLASRLSFTVLAKAIHPLHPLSSLFYTFSKAWQSILQPFPVGLYVLYSIIVNIWAVQVGISVPYSIIDCRRASLLYPDVLNSSPADISHHGR